MGVRIRGMAACACAVLALAGCGGGSGGSGAASSGGGPLTLSQVEAKLQKAGYRITVYTPNEGVLTIDSHHKADAGFSIDASPSGQQLFASVLQTSDPQVRQSIIAHYSDESAPIVRGDLVFTISGTEPELQTIVKDAGDLGGGSTQTAGGSQSGSGSSPDASAAKAAMQQFITAYAAGDEKAVCASFTPQVLAKSQTFCDPSSIFYKRQPDPRVNSYQITQVTTSGQTAVATVTFQGVTEQVALRQVGGQWKIDTALGAGHLF